MALFYDIVPLSVTDDEDSEFSGVVKRQSAAIADVASRVLAAGTEYSRATLIAVFSLMEEAVRALVEEGYSVTTDNAVFQSTIKGTFGRSGSWDEGVNRVAVAVRPTKSFRTEAAEITPQFTGRVNTTGGAMIDTVTDAVTGATDGTITSGGTLTVRGNKLKCTGEGGEGRGDVDFLDAETGEVAATVATFVLNTHSRLVFICPTLSAGSYVMRVTTHYSMGKPLKSARRILSGTLSVP